MSEHEERENGGFIALEPLLFFIEQAGSIRNVSESVVRLSHMAETDIVGMHLREFLLKLNPKWEKALPLSVSLYLHSQIFLPWDGDNSIGPGWTVHALTVGEGLSASISLSFVPGLSPEMTSKVPERGLNESFGNVLHKLFLHAQQSDNRFRCLMKLLPGISFIQQSDLSFSSKGTELRMLLGLSSFSELEHQSWTDWIHPSDAPLFHESLLHCQSTHYPVSSKLRLILPDKRTLYLLDLRFPVFGLNGRISSFEVLWIDLTRQRTAEKRLHESAWKDSLAEVSASLTHDFNNLMTGIVNLTDMARTSSANTEKDEKDEASHDLDLIWKSAKQAQNLVQQVVSLNRNRPGNIELFDLKSFVKEQYDLIRIVLPQRIRFEMRLGDEELPVRLDKAILARAILNFATNSRDAISRKGDVVLSLNIINLSTYPRDHTFTSLCPTSGRAVELVFSDDGDGISAQHINHIFCPYFSTKTDKSGTGLGLSSLYRYAEGNGFDFGVRSTEGEGTEMLLLLPLDELRVEQDADMAELPKNQPFKPGFQDDLNIAIYSSDIKYAAFMESNLEQDFGVQANLLKSCDQVLTWFGSSNAKGSVFVVMAKQFDEVPEILLSPLELSFGQTSRIFILNSKNADDSHNLEHIKKYFDIVLVTTESPNHDNLQILRALGHSALFALHDFS